MQRIRGDLRQLQGDANTAMSCQHRFWGAEGTQGAHRGHTDTCGHEEHLYPFLFSCCFTGALPGCAVFFPLPSCRHALVAAALCIRSRSSNDSSASSGRESDAHLSPAASHGAARRRFVPRRRRQAARPQRCRPSAPARQRETTPPRRTPRLLALEALPSLRAAPRPLLSAPPAPCPSATALCRTLRTDAIPAAQRSAASPGRTRRQTRCLTFRRRAHHLLPAAAPHTAPRRPPHGRPPPPSAQKRRTRSQTEGNAERAFIGGGAARRARAPCATRKLPARRPGDRPAPGRRPAAAGRRSGLLSRAGPRCRRRAATGCRPGRGAVRPAG